MTTTTDKYSIDRPISGDVQDSHKTEVEQATPEEFLAAVDAILAVPGVLAIGWNQHTPYFNDGEACEFGVGEVSVRLDPEVFGEIVDEEAYYLPEEENWVSEYGLYTYVDNSYRNRKWEVNGVSTEPIRDALENWRSSAFEKVALKNFGDHAVVIATPEGFSVEFYEHD